MSWTCFRVNPITSIPGNSAELKAVRIAVPSKSDNPPGLQVPGWFTVLLVKADHSPHKCLLSEGRQCGGPVPCLMENASVLLSPHCLKWQLSLGHAGTLTDRLLSSTGIFLFSGQHRTEAAPRPEGDKKAQRHPNLKATQLLLLGSQEKVPGSASCMNLWPLQPGTLREQE